MCARNWWVRPVSGCNSTQAARLPARSMIRKRVLAGRPCFIVDMHFLAAGAGLLGERRVDQPLIGIGHPDDQRPIDLARGAPGKGLGEMPRRARGPRHQQRARRVLVEPVDQLGPAVVVIGEPVEQAVEMLGGLGPALRRQARRLVEHESCRGRGG